MAKNLIWCSPINIWESGLIAACRSLNTCPFCIQKWKPDSAFFTKTAPRSLPLPNAPWSSLLYYHFSITGMPSTGPPAKEHSLNVLYHFAIRFATNAPHRTHHCDLYTLTNWPPLEIRRNIHWLMLLFKTLLGLTPPYLTQLLHLRPPPPPHPHTHTHTQHPFCSSHSVKCP